jgi:hypothetical protein
VAVDPGTYVEAALNLVSGVHVTGAGADVVRIVPEVFNQSVLMRAYGIADSTVVEGLSLDGLDIGFTGLQIDSTSGVHVRRCRVVDFVVGVTFSRIVSRVVLGGSLEHANDIDASYLNMFTDGPDSVDATYNYWGTTDFGAIAQRLLGPVRHIPATDATHTRVLDPAATAATLEEEARPGLRIFPNPFVSQVSMSIETRRPGSVTVSVFDVHGRRVRDLIDRPMPGGARSVTWDGRDATGATVAPGVYVIRLGSPDQETARRIVKLPR